MTFTVLQDLAPTLSLNSSPSTLPLLLLQAIPASLLFLKHIPAPGPLHMLLPSPEMLCPEIFAGLYPYFLQVSAQIPPLEEPSQTTLSKTLSLFSLPILHYACTPFFPL